jgi:glycosyltransferase domain-containing protein
MKKNDIITIVIPTYNRPGYLKRLLGYYNDCRIAHQIIIADGGADETKKANRETISSFQTLKVLHLHGYSPETPPLERLIDALKHVNTKYSIICADDDFITPNGIDRSINFLEDNPDFSIVHGRYITFHVESGENGENTFCWEPAYISESITSPNSADRLIRHLSGYLVPTFYAVHRTDLLQMVWSETYRFTKDDNFSELLASMLAIIYGKMKCLDIMYCARDASNVGITKHLTMIDYINSGTYDKQYAAFRECLAKHLSRQAHLNLKKAEKIVDKAMTAYLKKLYISASPKKISYSTSIGYFLDYLKLHKGVRSMLRWLYMKLTKWMSTKKPVTETPSSIYGDDLNKIRFHVLSHSR